jgi:hypothetical protein
MLKMILGKRYLNTWTEFSFLRKEFLDQLNNYKISRKILYYGLSYRLCRLRSDNAVTE